MLFCDFQDNRKRHGTMKTIFIRAARALWHALDGIDASRMSVLPQLSMQTLTAGLSLGIRGPCI